MRFAGSSPAVAAMGVVSGYNPGAIGSQAMKGRSVQRQAGIKGDAFVAETSILNEGRLAAAEAGIAAEEAQVPGMGETIGMSVLQGLGNFAGPIASGLKGPGITSYDQIPAEGLRGAAAGGGPNAYLGTGGKYGTFQPGSYIDYNPAIG